MGMRIPRRVSFMAAITLLLASLAGAAVPLGMGRASSDPPAEVWALVLEDVERRGEDGAGLVFESAEAVEWPDGCLGAGDPDMICTQVIVPGWRVLVTLTGVPYEYRTDGPPDWVGSRQARRLPR